MLNWSGMTQAARVIEVAKRIWEIGAESPEAGNAVMDTLGDQAYLRIMRIAAKNAEKPEDLVDEDERDV